MSNRDQALQSFYASRQRGGSGVYGGPQMPAADPAPLPFAAQGGGGMSPAQQRLAELAQKNGSDQGGGGNGGLFSGATGALGKVLGIGAQAISVPTKAVVGATEEWAKLAPDFLEVAQPFSLLVDEDKSREDGRSFVDRITDPTYGYGSITHKTGNKWLDRGIGLVGDVAMDPLTYVGGAATKLSSHTIGRAGREYMATTLARAGFADDVVGEASRRGVAYLDDTMKITDPTDFANWGRSAREVAGVGAPGLYFGIGKQSKRIPGTERLGRALEKGFANTRVNTVSRLTSPVGAKLRTVPDLQVAHRVMDAGRTIDGVTPTMAAERISFYNDVERVAKTFAELKGREVTQLLGGVDSRAAVAMTHALEAGDTSAEAFRAVFRAIHEELTAKGVQLGDLGADYIPHRWTREGWEFLTKDPRGRHIAAELKIDLTADPSALKRRLITGGEDIKLPDGSVFKVPPSGTVKDINEAFTKQFGVRALEDDIRRLMSGYITEAGRALGLREAWQGLARSKSNIIQRLEAVSVEQLDELATITSNQEMRKLLEKTVKARGEKLGARAAAAGELTEKLRKAAIDDIERSVKALGADHTQLQGELKELLKQVKKADTDEAAITREFAKMYAKAGKEFDRVVKELQVATERVDALRGEQALADSLRTDASRQLPSSSGPRFARRVDDAVGGLRDRGGNIDDSLTGVILRDGTTMDLYRSADGGHWWQRRGEDEWYGPFALADSDDAADARDAIVALSDIEDGLVSPVKRATGETGVSAAIRQAEIAEARLADQMDMAVDALERLDDLGNDLFAASAEMRKWDVIADSPELLAEIAATRAVPEQTTRFVPDLEPALGEGGSMRMKRMDALYDLAVGDEAAEFERASRAAARSQEIVEAKSRRIEVLKGRLERVTAQLAVEDQALRVAGEGWVPLELRARRSRLMDRLANSSEELKDVVRRDRLAERRQERLRGRAPEAAQARKSFDEVDAELWEVKADSVNGPDEGGLPLWAQRRAQEELPEVEARYYELGTIKMELQQDLREIADEYVAELGEGTTRKPFADARAAKEADLGEVMAAIKRVDEEILEARKSPNAARFRMIQRLNDYRDDTINEIANSLQTKKWHERLSKIENQPAHVNSPKVINAQRDLVRKIERATDNYHVTKYQGEPGNRTLSGRLVTEVGERRSARTAVEIAQENRELLVQLNELPPAEPNPLLNIPIRGQEVTDEEAQVIADHLRSLSDELKKADAKAKSLENELATKYPSANQGTVRHGGVIPKTEVTNDGVPIGSQTLTKDEYDMLVKGAEPTIGGRRSGRGNRGMQQVNDADELFTGSRVVEELDGEMDAAAALKGNGFTDETIDQADRFDQNVDAVAGDLPDGGFARQALAYTEIWQTDAESTLRGAYADALKTKARVREQYNNALRAYGLEETAGDGFAYGRWGNILLVDTSGRGAPGQWAAWNTNNAISLTDKELEQEVRKAGLWPKSGRRPGHKQMAALLGWKSSLFKPDQVKYETLPDGLAEMVERSAARSQIERMTTKGRQSVLADARSAERFRLQPIIDQRRALEEKVRRNTEELAEIRDVRGEMIGKRDAAAVRVADIQPRVDLATRVAAAGRDSANAASLARRKADQEVLAEGLRGVEAGGQVQARNEAVAGAVADRARAEQKAEALIQIESTLGAREAQAVQALTVDRAISGLKAGNVQSQAWSAAARKERLDKVASGVPKRLKASKPTYAAVKKQLTDLRAVLDDAATEGTPESLVTAQLFEQATLASTRLESEELFQGALKDAAKRARKANGVLRDPNASDAAKLKAAQESPAGVVMKLAHDGFERIEEAVFPEGADFAVKSEMNRMLKEFETTLRGSEPEWLRYYDEANKFFKTWATATPGFHVRNAMSATFMNMTEGVGVRAHEKAMSDWREYVRASKEGRVQEWFAGQPKETRDAFEAVFGSGTGGGFDQAELGSAMAGGLGVLKDNAITRTSRKVGVDWVEGPARLALAQHYISKGGDVQSAMNAVTRIHFDYSQVSDFDKQMKRIIPFWTFMSRNLPLQFEQMLARPKAYAIYGHLMRNFSDDKEGEGMPSWIAEAGGFTVARDVGFLGGRDAVLRPDLPFTRMGEEMGKFFPNPTRLASSMSPFLRVPFELGMNHSAFYNDQLFGEGEGGVGDQLAYAANNTLPPLAALQRLAGMGDYEGKAFEKQLNYVGAPIVGVSDEQRANALRYGN